MSHHLASIVGAIRRVRDGWPLEKYDQGLIIPLLESCLAEIALSAIPFRQVGRKFVVDTTEFRNLNGFHYLQALLKEPGEYIACKQMSPISGPVVFEPVVEHSFVRSRLNQQNELIKKLKWMRARRISEGELSDDDKEEEFKIADELLHIKSVLNETTGGGRIKHIHNDYDRNRQTVTKCIRLAISYLEKCPDTAHVGYYLRKHIKLGARCRYTGKKTWICS